MHFSTVSMPADFSALLDPATFLHGLGPATLVVVALMVFIESGVLFPFLPGDSLLFTAGLLHRQLDLSLPLLIGVVMVAAAAGDQVGYLLGRTFGQRWLGPDVRFVKPAHLARTEEFFARHGAKAVVLARFVPVVRTFAPLVAGIAHYDYKRFTLWNVIGAVGWSVSLVLLGTWLGRYALVAKNIDAIAILIVVLSVLPAGIGMLRSRRRRLRATIVPGDNG